MPVNTFLVETAGHTVLVDTGWPEECVSHPLSHLGFGLWFASEPVTEEGEGVPAQLGKLGLAPEDLDAIILTHLDCDHASGLQPLKRAQHIFCSKEEWTEAQTRDVRYRSQFWEGMAIGTLEMAEDPAAPFGLSCDVFGDGSLKARPGIRRGLSRCLHKESRAMPPLPATTPATSIPGRSRNCRGLFPMPML